MGTAEVLTMAALKQTADELAYLNAPVEARLASATLIALKLMLEPDPRNTPLPPPSPFETMTGLKLIVDPDVPPLRLEFRDRDGNVVSSFDLPVSAEPPLSAQP